MSDWQGKQVWLTGASSGIGRELALRLAAGGARVYASARDAAALSGLAASARPGSIVALPLDVGSREQVQAAAGRLRAQTTWLDIVILNAGTCEYLDVQRFDSTLFERLVKTNFLGAVYTVEAALPLLRAGDTCHIVGVGSTAAWTGLPRAEAYGSSKAALHYFLDSLRVDLTAEGFAVSVVAPGFVDTPLTARNDFPMPLRISAGRAAELILAGMARRRAEIHFPLAFSLALKTLRLLPVAWRNRLYQRLVRRELPA